MKKRSFLAAIVALLFVNFATVVSTVNAQSQWTTNGNNINNTNTGNVGIGTPTPSEAIHLFNTSGVGQIELQGGTKHAGFVGYWNEGGLILSSNRNIRTGNNYNGSFPGAQIILGNFDGNKGDISFFTTSTGAAPTSSELLRIKSSGNIGIGTNIPAYKLDVVGEVRASGGIRFGDGTIQTTAATGGGSGTITGVTAGTGLGGGGTTGSVSLTNTDRGSDQFIFKNIADATGTTKIFANKNNDTLRFAGSGGTKVTFDNVAKMVTIDATASTGLAANISAGQFGQNTGGGNYTFPGNVTVNGNINAKYQDIAEWVESSQRLSAGTVVVLDPTRSNEVIASTNSYDTRVAGVVSAQPGISLGDAGEGKVLVATTGRVKVKVDASNGPIRIGDLLVTSDITGVAMKSEPVEVGKRKMHLPGTLIGKALEPLEKGQGEILVLLSLQ